MNIQDEPISVRLPGGSLSAPRRSPASDPRTGVSAIQDTVTVMLATPRGGNTRTLEIPRRIGSVKLGDQIGKGATGVVFGGFDDLLGRRVAVKIVQPEAAAAGDGTRFVEGLRSAAAVKHPNIVTIHHVDLLDGMPVIVMEFVDGAPLRELLRRAGTFDAPLALHCAHSIASAVAALHDAHVIHRDLKPANILFDQAGETHVCDFGLACQHSEFSCVRGDDGIAGTPLYMGPELFDGVVSPQGDVYALGVMLFEMLRGRPPFSADTMEEMKRCHAAAEVPLEWLRRAGAPDDVAELIGRALHKVRIMRHKSAAHFLRAVESLAQFDPRTAMQRRRLAGMAGAVLASQRSADSDAESSRAPAEPARDTFDLLQRRAAAKRRRE